MLRVQSRRDEMPDEMRQEEHGARADHGARVAAHYIRHDAGLFDHALGSRIALAQQFPTGGDGALGGHDLGSCFGIFLRP